MVSSLVPAAHVLTLATQAAAQAAADTGSFPAWLRITHFINFLVMGLLIRSGWEIIASHPRMYWNEHCTPGSEWIRFTKDKVPWEEGAFTARDDQRSLHPLVSLPGKALIGLGRAWHGLVTTIWLLNGIVYVTLLFATGQWRRIVPTSWDVLPQAWESMKVYLSLEVPSIEHFTPYDALQQLMYFVVVFVAAPLMIITGPAMSPAVVGRFPWYGKMFGGRQRARSLHFLGMAFYFVFVCIHVPLVFIVHPEHNLTNMVFGGYDPARVAQAYTTVIISIIAVVAFWIACSYWTLADTRRAQRLVWGATRPVRALTVDHLRSRQQAAGRFTEADISPFHWVNTRTPTQEESPEWHALAADGFAGFRLEVDGLVDHQVSLSLDELREVSELSQITMHTCMQGWTGIAKWTGIRVRDVLAAAGGPVPEARYVMFESFGKAQHMHDGRPVEPYYTCLPMDLVMEDETILAWGRNGEPLSPMFGAPLRLRVESNHGYKMVKWVRRVTLIRDYREVGDGMGGTREDSGYQDVNARI